MLDESHRIWAVITTGTVKDVEGNDTERYAQSYKLAYGFTPSSLVDYMEDGAVRVSLKHSSAKLLTLKLIVKVNQGHSSVLLFILRMMMSRYVWNIQLHCCLY